MSSIAKAGWPALALLTLAGCKTVAEKEQPISSGMALAYLADKPADLHPHFYVALSQGQRNQVLNNMRLALASLQMGEDALAAQLLDEALGLIETIYADNEQAAAARGLFTKEAVKDFKGEPYERAMAYFYRGLLHLKSGDYDNARASFKAGFLQDSFAEEEQYAADFGLLQYLQGWASRCRGNEPTARDDFLAFKDIRADFPLPAAEHNTLVLLESGQAPFKFGDTDPNSSKKRYLRYGHQGDVPVPQVSYEHWVTIPAPTPVRGKPAPAPKRDAQTATIAVQPLEDLYFQASTRGGREVDRILRGKAQFKEAAHVVGTIAGHVGGAVAGAALARGNNRDAAAGAAIILIALLVHAAAEAAEPDADTRYWDNLSEVIFAGTATLPADIRSVTVRYVDGQGQEVKRLDSPVHRANGCNIVWARHWDAIPPHPRAPYSTSEEAMNSPVILPQALPAAPVEAERPADPAARPPEQVS